MFNDPAAVFAAYAGGSAAFAYAMTKVSPAIGPRLRSIFAGVVPMAFIYGEELVMNDAVVLTGTDLMQALALLVVGTGTATFVSSKSDKTAKARIAA